jgi:hypothetical protein
MNELCLYHGKLYWIGAQLHFMKGRKMVKGLELHDVVSKEYVMDALFKEVVKVDSKDYPEVFL